MAEDEMVGWHRPSLDTNLSKLWEMVEDRGARHAAVHGVAKSWTQLSDCTTSVDVGLCLSALLFHWCICGHWSGHLSVQDARLLLLWPPGMEGSSLSEEPDTLELGRSFARISLQSDEATRVACECAFSSVLLCIFWALSPRSVPAC